MSAPGGTAQRGRHLRMHEMRDEMRERLVLHAVGDGLAAREIAEIGHGGMRAVEQPELHQLEGRDVGDEGRVPLRAALRKAVLDHPVVVDLGDDRPGVLEPGRGGDAGAVGIRRGGHDAVHHGGGEGDVLRHILPKCGASAACASRVTTLATVRPLAGRLSQHSTVKGGSPRAFRARSASTRKPGAERGGPGCARSWMMSGCCSFSSPVAGSWQ